MKILNLRLSQSQSNLKAFFDLEIENGIILKGFKVAQGPTGLFVGVPSEKDQNGKWWDRVIIPKEMKDELNRLALEEYKRLGGSGEASTRGNERGGERPHDRAADTDLPF